MTPRVLAGFLVVTLFVVAVLIVPFGAFVGDRERERLAIGLERDATVLASIYEETLEGRLPVDDTLAADYAARTGARVVVIDAGGISVVDTGADVPRDFLSNRAEVVAALDGERATITRHSDTLGTDLLFVAVPVASGGEVYGAVRLSLPTSEVDQRVRGFWWSLAGVGVVVMVSVGLVGWVAARSLTRPVRRLESTAAQIASGDLGARATDIDAPGELADLARTFDEMASRVEALVSQQRAFVSDASHQLRTPLTALRLRLENLEGSVAPEDRADLDAAIDETERLGQLVEQLLALARADRATPELVTVDAAAVAAERHEIWSAVAEEAGVELTIDRPATAVPVRAAAGALEQVLDNLIDNALLYGGGAVHLGVVAAGDVVELHVADRGPGLGGEELAKAFDRFWRGDRTRAGSGLGLAVVRRLAELSGGTAELWARDGGGLDAVVTFPAAASSTTVDDAAGRSGPG
ncbi:MAG: ATP-binding protein [Actinomycetota bacterium]|nr:ATP-binding protein [Actinomycetota bacterium]